MSTRSVAETLPRTLPSTTTSRAVMLAPTWPLRPMVTRLPGRLIEPSTLPSIYSDSVPEISPLTNKPLPMVACSAAATPARLAGFWTGAGGAGRGGSGVGLVFWGSGWLGFHIALKDDSFSVPWGLGDAKAMANGANPNVKCARRRVAAYLQSLVGRARKNRSLRPLERCFSLFYDELRYITQPSVPGRPKVTCDDTPIRPVRAKSACEFPSGSIRSPALAMHAHRMRTHLA